MDTSIIECADQLIIRPSITLVDGKPILSKIPAVAIPQGMSPVIEMILRDTEGRPINFTSCGFGTGSSSSATPVSSSSSATAAASVKLRVREAMDVSQSTSVDIQGVFVQPDAGVVRARVPIGVTELTGIFNGNWGVISAEGDLVYSSRFFIVVEKSEFGTVNSNIRSGLPSVSEVRLRMRDNSPDDNPLLNTLEFDLSEICESMLHCVRQWNTMQPPIGISFNTTNFPNPYVLMDGVMGDLYLAAAKHYRRNQLAYTAGGLSVDDKNKAQEYEVTGDKMIQEYLKWVKMTKIQINKQAWDGSMGSGYAHIGRYR